MTTQDNNWILRTSIAFVLAFVALGCGGQAGEDPAVAASTQALDRADCEAQRDECLASGGLIGVFFCNIEHQQCLLEASQGLPSAVLEAVGETATCRAEADDCLAAAETVSDRVACREEEARCVAGVLDVNVPAYVDATSQCVDDSVACINDATRVSDLTVCGEDLTSCSLDATREVVPDEVATVVGDVLTCTDSAGQCIAEAESASELTACNEEQVQCVAGSVDVGVPDLPGSELVGCAETASECLLRAESISDVTRCTEELRECNQQVVDDTVLPEDPPLDCERQWTRCLTRQPLGFPECARELRECREAQAQ